MKAMRTAVYGMSLLVCSDWQSVVRFIAVLCGRGLLHLGNCADQLPVLASAICCRAWRVSFRLSSTSADGIDQRLLNRDLAQMLADNTSNHRCMELLSVEQCTTFRLWP